MEQLKDIIAVSNDTSKPTTLCTHLHQCKKGKPASTQLYTINFACGSVRCCKLIPM